MDLAAIRSRLEKLNNKTKKQSNLWKPTDEHEVRCLPQPKSEDPFVERLFHYDIGKNPPILCPKNFGEDCSICEFAEKLRAWKDENGNDKPESVRKSDFNIFRKLQAKPRYFVAMVERGKEAAGPMYWSVTAKVYEKLLGICANDDRNTDRDDGGGSAILTSPTAGTDLKVSFKPPGKKGNATTFFLTDVEPRLKTSKLHVDAKESKKILDAIAPIDTIFQKMESAEVTKLFMEFMKPDPEQASQEPGKEYGAEEKVASNNAEKLTGKRTVDEAFDDLMTEG